MARRHSQATLDRAQALYAKGMSMSDIAAQLNVSIKRLYIWRQRGWKICQDSQRPAPDDFAAQCVDKIITDLCRHYKASAKTVRRWLSEMPGEVLERRYCTIGHILDENGRAKRIGRPAPQDFEAVFLQLGVKHSAEHYIVSEHQIDHWLRSRPELRAKRREIVNAQKNTGRGRALSRIQRFGQQTAMTLVDNAAHYLRRFKRQVYEPAKIMVLDEIKNGIAKYRPMGPEGFHYVDGRGLIPTEEMLEMARQHGWQS